MFPPATLGERALEEDAGVRTATVVSVDGGVLARLDAETYRRSVMSEKQKRMLHMEEMEKEQAAIQMQARQRGRSQRKKLEERLAAKKEGRAWKGQKTALQDNGVDEAVMASGLKSGCPVMLLAVVRSSAATSRCPSISASVAESVAR